MSLEPRALSDVYPSSPGLEVFQFIFSILYFCPTEEVFESVEPAYSIFLFWLDPSDRFLVSLKAVAPSKFEFPCFGRGLPDDFKLPGSLRTPPDSDFLVLVGSSRMTSSCPALFLSSNCRLCPGSFFTSFCTHVFHRISKNNEFSVVFPLRWAYPTISR